MDLWIFIYIVMFFAPFLTALTVFFLPAMQRWYFIIPIGIAWVYFLTKLGQYWGWV